jgi:hypothetical protein
MDVTSTGPLPVSSLVWQPRPGAWVLTVVCKATWILRPGECTLAPQQEAVLAEDRHHRDDPAHSLRCPRDLVPVKPGADVMLVGSVHAPERRPVRALDARLQVAEVDKTIEAIVDRTVRVDGSVREGAPFAQMPILYERTGGGAGTRNPVGMPRDARDAEGGMVLPNLQRPGASLHNVFEPVGFGPIAPAWPERRDRLTGAGAEFSFRDLAQRPLPEGMDLAFFNAAPRDQQLRAFAEKVRIELTNLHPEHAHLVTAVPATPPRAVLEGRREGPVAVTLRADTLWIDTDRGLCTLTFRGMVPLQAADERGRIVVSWEPERPAARADELPAVKPVPRKYDMTADIPLEARRGAGAPLPFAPAAQPAPAPVPFPAAAQPAATPPAFAQPMPSTVPATVARAPEPPSLAPPSPSAPASPWAIGSRPLESMPAPLQVVARPAEPASSVFDVSTTAAGAAAARPLVEPLPARPAPEPDTAPAAPRAEAQEALELIWFDPEGVPRIRRKAEWRPLLDALEQAPLDPDFDDPAFAKDPMVIEDRREVFEILAQATPMSAEGLDTALGRCLRPDGKFVPALALFAAELELPFDELSALRATLTTVSPLAGQDEALKSTLQAAKDFLATPGLMSAPAVAEGLTKRIEDAFAQGKRVVPTGYLEAQRERALLEQRQYQRRAVFGGKHLRGLLKLGASEPAAAKPGSTTKPSAGSGGVVVPAYLPESLADVLPMLPRFRARMVAEIRLAADRYESHPASLKVIALARAAPPPKAGSGEGAR